METTQTKMTTATVRIALVKDYSTFEVSLGLENPTGLTMDEIIQTQNTCYLLAQKKADEHKTVTPKDVKAAVKSIESNLYELKKVIEGKEPEKPADPKEIETIQKMPQYPSKK
jgi:hypothetical protein